jgi:CDP-diacylglycerol--serine O-phosphatidyltransferase
VLAFQWGLSELGRVGWAVGFIYTTATAMRLARFNIQSTAQVDKRYFVGMPCPPAAGVIAATVFMWPTPLVGHSQALAALPVVLVPAAVMVSTIRFRSFKTDFGWRRSYLPLLLFALFVALIFTEPSWTLMALAYGYLLSAFVGMAISRLRVRRAPAGPPAGGAP